MLVAHPEGDQQQESQGMKQVHDDNKHSCMCAHIHTHTHTHTHLFMNKNRNVITISFKACQCPSLGLYQIIYSCLNSISRNHDLMACNA